MVLKESAEMYLETIYQLSLRQSAVRSVDVAGSMKFSRASVSRGVSLLKQEGYLEMDADNFLILTETGKAVAEKIYERHKLISAALIELGVDADIAAEDACRIEHVISEQSMEAIRAHMRKYNKGIL